jgi:hypothetical protein
MGQAWQANQHSLHVKGQAYMAVAAAPRNRRAAPEVTYKYLPGFRGRVDPEVVGRWVDEQEREHGVCPAVRLLDDARDPGSPRHAAFDWDDRAMAERERLRQAGALIRAVVRVEPGAERPIVRVCPRVCVSLPQGQRGYMDSARAMDEAATREQVVAEAEKMLRAVINRYRGIPGLLPHLREALDRLQLG